MSDIQYGLKEKLLTEEQLYEFRFLTTALGWTNSLEENATGNTITAGSERSNTDLYRFAAELTDLLVRHVEVVAVTASDAGGILFQTACDNSDEPLTDDNAGSTAEEKDAPSLEATVGYAQNLRDEQRSKEVDKQGRHPALQVHIPSTTADAMGDSVGCWLLSKTAKDVKADVYPQTTVSFSQHAANLVRLIKATYEQVSADTFAASRDQLRNYMLLTSTTKIVLRIEKGTKKRNIYDYLSKSGVDLIDFMSNESYQFKSMLRGMRADKLLHSEFTEDARKVIVSTIAILEMRCSVDADKMPQRTQEALENTRKLIEELTQFKKRLLNSSESIVYDEYTASRLQDILSAVLGHLVASFERLAARKRKAQMFKSAHHEAVPGSSEFEKIERAGHSLDRLSQEAGLWLDALTRLKQPPLRKYLLTNLQLLRGVHGLKNVKKTDNVARDTEGLPVFWTPSKSNTGLPTSESSGLYSSSIATDELADADYQDPANMAEELRKLKLEKRNQIDPEVEQLDTIAEKKEWEQAAMAWLDLVCLHWTAYLSLSSDGKSSKRNNAYKGFVQNASFKHFETTQDHRDRQLIVKQYLEKFKLRSGAVLSGDQCQKIRTWLLNEGRGYSTKAEHPHAQATNFRGTYHCETILISIFLLGKKRDDIVDKNIESESAVPSALRLQLPSKEITDALQNAMRVLPVSKRCCPACFQLVLYLIENERADLIYPGNHAVWSPAALPPWIPKEAGLKVIAAARTALQYRFEKILEGGRSSSPKEDEHIKSDDTSPDFSHMDLDAPPDFSGDSRVFRTPDIEAVDNFEYSKIESTPPNLSLGPTGTKRPQRNFTGEQAGSKKPKGEGDSDDEDV